MMYEPRYMRHIIGAIRVTGESPEGITVEANYAIFEPLVNDLTRIAQHWALPRAHRTAGQGNTKIAEKHCVTILCLVPNSLFFLFRLR